MKSELLNVICLKMSGLMFGAFFSFNFLPNFSFELGLGGTIGQIIAIFAVWSRDVKLGKDGKIPKEYYFINAFLAFALSMLFANSLNSLFLTLPIIKDLTNPFWCALFIGAISESTHKIIEIFKSRFFKLINKD